MKITVTEEMKSLLRKRAEASRRWEQEESVVEKCAARLEGNAASLSLAELVAQAVEAGDDQHEDAALREEAGDA